MAARAGSAVQDVPIGELQAALRAQGQLLDATAPPPPPPPPPAGDGVLRLAPCAGAPLWAVTPADGSLRRAGGGGAPLCASVWGYSNATGGKLVSAACHTARAPHNQAFDVIDAAGGGVQLHSRMSGLCAARSSGTAGGTIVQAACGSEEARWVAFADAPKDAPWAPYDGSGLCVSDA